jgi:hypothetical protein
MGADLIEHSTGEFSRAVYVKGGSANPLVFKGTVTTATDATHFASTDLIGHGNDALVGWYVYVFHDAGGAGAAPQGEKQPISGYVSSTGTFTHTAFTADLAVDDEVLILHESIVSDSATIDNIFSIVNALLTLTETGGTVTTDGTEQNVYINNAPSSVFDPKIVQIDFTNHTATETVVIREYYRIKSGGGLIKKDEKTFAGVQDPLLKNVTLEPNRFGVQVTIEKTAGTNRGYDFEAVYRI